MTLAEFNQQGWRPNMWAEYKGKVYSIASCDFDEALVGLDGVIENSDDISWVRCENITLITK